MIITDDNLYMWSEACELALVNYICQQMLHLSQTIT